MARKRKGSLNLTEALDLLDEATTSRGYPNDGTGVAGDDDRPPGNIVYGEKYKKTPYFNKLTTFQKSWEVDIGDWTWDEFKNSGGMEDLRNYSNTIQSMKDLFPKETWEMIWKRMKYVSPDAATAAFKDAGQPWRKGGEDQTGSEKHAHADIDMNKDGEFEDATVKESIENRINDIIL